MSYSVKFVLIIFVVAVFSFFIAHIVIPERGASEYAEMSVAAHPPAPLAAAGPAAGPDEWTDEEIPVVEGTPVQKQIGRQEVRPEPAARTPAAQTPALQVSAPPVPLAAARPDTAAHPLSEQRQAGQSNLRVNQAAVCTAVRDRTPFGVADRFDKDTPSLHYFTHITGVRDTTTWIRHMWYHEGKLMQTSVLHVGSYNWRTHSRRNLANRPDGSDITGRWRVDVVDNRTGKVLETTSFVIE